MGVQDIFIASGVTAVVICIVVDRIRKGSNICRGIAIPSAIGVIIAFWQRSRGVGIDQSWEGFVSMKFLLWMVLICAPPVTLEALKIKRKDQLKYLGGIWVTMVLIIYITGFRFFP